MMSSMLGRMLLDASMTTADEMTFSPTADGDHRRTDEMLEEVAARLDPNSSGSGVRQPEEFSMPE